MAFDLGDTVPLAADATDPAGTLTNATGAVLTVTLPDGTAVTPPVTNPPAVVGRYTVDYVSVQAGRHLARWVFTDPASAFVDAFDVRPAAPPLMLSLADSKRHLAIDPDDTDQDEELRDWIESVTAGVEHHCGAVVVREVVERHSFRCSPVRVLRTIPALSLTTVAPILNGGTSYEVADLDLDGETGIVQRLDGGQLLGPLRFTYRAGRPVIPANLRIAGKIILTHLWRVKYGGSRGGVVGGSEDFSVTEQVPGFGYAIPNRALQLMEPHRLPPGVG